MKIAIIYGSKFSALSYNDDWLDAFTSFKDNNIHVVAYNYLEIGVLESQKILFDFDYVVLLHSTNSNGFSLPKLYRLGSLNFRKAKIIFFVGNEYKLMPEKISFIKLNHIDFIVSQLPQDTAEWLYAGTKAKIISLPHALNEKAFYMTKPFLDRKIDVGNRSYEYPWYLGDTDRIKTLTFLSEINSNFIIDVSTNPKERFNRTQWADFLNNCKFTVASEAGSSYLERDDKTRKLVNQYIIDHPDANFDTIHTTFFKDYQNPINGKCISSRHFDAIGTMTCQVLLAGQYNDILKPNEHYIELKKDFSNMEEVIEKMQDDTLRTEIVNTAYEYVINNHTHKHRIALLLELLF